MSRNRPAPALTRILVAVVLSCVLTASAGCDRLPVKGLLTGVIQPSIDPSSTQIGTRRAKLDFPFEGATVTLDVPVDSAVYSGAVNAEKSAVFIGGEKPPNWISDYYRAFIQEKHQDAFYTSLADALHQVRAQRKLDSSRYIELVAAMAQRIEYRVDPGNLAPKFPIETFTDGYGDCDDKALLAAGVLARDGYDVAVLFFGKEEHVALGVRAPGLEYKNTHYAYVEMTEPSLVGIPPEALQGNVKLTSKPLVIPIGDGVRGYAAADQIHYITTRLAQIASERTQLADQVKRFNSELQSKRTTLDGERVRIESSGSSASSGSIDEYNRRVNDFNAAVRQADAAIARYNSLVELERFAAHNQNARPQLYNALR